MPVLMWVWEQTYLQARVPRFLKMSGSRSRHHGCLRRALIQQLRQSIGARQDPESIFVKHFGLPVGGSARVGMLTSAYPFGMLAGLTVWPRLSDKRGMRKPILVLSLGGVGLGLAAQSVALARNAPLWTFLSLRGR